MIVKLLALTFFWINIGFGSVSKEPQHNYATKINDAFFRQSLGSVENTNIAFLIFKQGYNEAKEAGESIHKLNLISDLFVWYRKYGYSAGEMLAKSGCSDEYLSSAPISRKRTYFLGEQSFS